MYGAHRDLHVLTHSFPTRRSSDLGDDAAVVDEVEDEFTTAGVSHVDGDAQLVARVVVEQPALVRVRVRVLGAVGAHLPLVDRQAARHVETLAVLDLDDLRSEEHTSELQSLMRNSYAVFCLKKKKK